MWVLNQEVAEREHLVVQWSALLLPGLHSAAKKKKKIVEEKHPGDKGGCERDNRTREIRDGRRGEERRGA